jgi:hypothetical protein
MQMNLLTRVKILPKHFILNCKDKKKSVTTTCELPQLIDIFLIN